MRRRNLARILAEHGRDREAAAAGQAGNDRESPPSDEDVVDEDPETAPDQLR